MWSFMVHWLLLYIVLSCGGVNGLLTLSSVPVSEVGQSVTVCPHTRVTRTATQIISLTWADQNGDIETLALNLLNTSLDRPPYNITLMAENATGLRADFISTLEVIVDDIDSGTTITCRISQSEVKQLIIHQKGAPLPPHDVTIVTDDFTTEDFSILISWRGQGTVDNYTVSTNTTTPPVTTNRTTLALEGQYNTHIEITLAANDCGRTSDDVTGVIYEAGCSPPTPPVNGSVGEFTSSRVGAQVTYSCDTDLVLVGERVATCSLPSLQWIPSSDDITCVQQPIIISTRTTATNTPNPRNEHNALSRAGAVAITTVVCVVCSFTAGLLLGVLLTRCSVHCHGKQKRGQTERPPVYEDIQSENKTTTIELQHNEAYGHLPS